MHCFLVDVAEKQCILLYVHHENVKLCGGTMN